MQKDNYELKHVCPYALLRAFLFHYNHPDTRDMLSVTVPQNVHTISDWRFLYVYLTKSKEEKIVISKETTARLSRITYVDINPVFEMMKRIYDYSAGRVNSTPSIAMNHALDLYDCEPTARNAFFINFFTNKPPLPIPWEIYSTDQPLHKLMAIVQSIQTGYPLTDLLNLSLDKPMPVCTFDISGTFVLE